MNTSTLVQDLWITEEETQVELIGPSWMHLVAPCCASSQAAFLPGRVVRKYRHRHTTQPRKEPIMTSRYTTRLGHHAAALCLALAATLVIFSGVSSLASPSHAGAMLVHVQSTASQS
jgi:hypothetical protein